MPTVTLKFALATAPTEPVLTAQRLRVSITSEEPRLGHSPPKAPVPLSPGPRAGGH